MTSITILWIHDIVDAVIEPARNWLVNHGFESLAQYVHITVLGFALLLLGIYKFFLWLIKRWHKHRLKTIAKTLRPFFEYVELRKATKYYIETKCQNIPPSDMLEPIDNLAKVVRQSLSEFFLEEVFDKNNAQKFYILLADSGMGKTTFMINLYVKYWCSRSKSHNIKLIPLSNKNATDAIKEIQNKEDTILLLDALDEDRNAQTDFDKRLTEIIDLAYSFRKVIITSRTQFFASASDVPAETGYTGAGPDGIRMTFHKLYVSPFSDQDIKRYLCKKYPILRRKKRRKAMGLVIKAPNLMVRPMLLNYIDDLIDSEVEFDSNFAIYRVMIDKWIDREMLRQPLERQRKFKDCLKLFSEKIAVEIYNKRNEKGGLYILQNEIQPLAEKFEIDMSLLELKSRSLLNRNSDENPQWKFAHKSILEYFLAQELISGVLNISKFNFIGLDQTRNFLVELFRPELTAGLQKEYSKFRHNKISKIWINQNIYELTSKNKISILSGTYLDEFQIISIDFESVGILFNSIFPFEFLQFLKPNTKIIILNYHLDFLLSLSINEFSMKLFEPYIMDPIDFQLNAMVNRESSEFKLNPDQRIHNSNTINSVSGFRAQPMTSFASFDLDTLFQFVRSLQKMPAKEIELKIIKANPSLAVSYERITIDFLKGLPAIFLNSNPKK